MIATPEYNGSAMADPRRILAIASVAARDGEYPLPEAFRRCSADGRVADPDTRTAWGRDGGAFFLDRPPAVGGRG